MILPAEYIALDDYLIEGDVFLACELVISISDLRVKLGGGSS